MKLRYTKKELEELYNCNIFRDPDKFWVAKGLPLTKDGDDCLFVQADGYDLNELHENIRYEIRGHCIVFDS